MCETSDGQYAMSRENIPALISEVERLTEHNDFLVELCKRDATESATLAAEWDALQAKVTQAESILSLLHHRGLVDSPNNRADVKAALDALTAKGWQS